MLPKHLRDNDPGCFYRRFAPALSRNGEDGLLMQAVHEWRWETLRRPYYNVYPSVIPMLTRLNLDLDFDFIRLPTPSLCVRLPKNPAKNPLSFDWKGEKVHVCSILMGEGFDGKGIRIHVDIGALRPGCMRLHPHLNLCSAPGRTLEQCLSDAATLPSEANAITVPDSLMHDCLRLCCTLCLLGSDPELISPDVLANDRAAYQQTGLRKYVEKAHRRGKLGWDVGRHIEVMPHYRRPHLMLAWTGKGHTVPKIVPRKGCLVHRDVVEKVPAGFLEEAVEIADMPATPMDMEAGMVGA
jgi:hypothetical protein